MRKIVGIAIVVLLFLLLSPWAMGIYLERLYPSIFKVYETSGFNVKVIQYHRGWFTSDAKIILQIQQQDVSHLLSELQLPIEYELNSKIQHGPIIYRPLHGLITMFGLASIQHVISGRNIKIGDFIGFTQKHFNQIKLAKINMKYPNSMIQIKLNDAESAVWITKDLNKLQGEWRLTQLIIADDIASISLPELIFQFDQHDPNDYYLLGTNQLYIPVLRWDEVGGKFLKVLDFKTAGHLDENDGGFSINRKLDFQKIIMNDRAWGPTSFEITGKKLNAASIKLLIQSYSDISQRGELYQSQLKQKIWMLIPTIIMKDTLIEFNHMNIKTQSGDFSFQGKMQWAESSPDNIEELLQTANANADLQISKNLLNQWIVFAARMPYFNQTNEDLENAYWDARDELNLNMRLNTFLIASMTDEGLLADADALDLLQLQKEYATLESYQNYLQKLYLNKNILRETNYRLFIQYLAVEHSLKMLVTTVKTQKEETLQSMKLQWKDWVKKGYVKENGENYQISAQQKDGKLMVSGEGV